MDILKSVSAIQVVRIAAGPSLLQQGLTVAPAGACKTPVHQCLIALRI